jgi:hypothetical protein
MWRLISPSLDNTMISNEIVRILLPNCSPVVVVVTSTSSLLHVHASRQVKQAI